MPRFDGVKVPSSTVHTCDVDLLNRVLREEFVGIYSEPVLQKFLDETAQS